MAVPKTGAHYGRSFIRDVIVATLVLVCLYGLAQGVQFQPIQITGYLLIVGFDQLEGTSLNSEGIPAFRPVFYPQVRWP